MYIKHYCIIVLSNLLLLIFSRSSLTLCYYKHNLGASLCIIRLYLSCFSHSLLILFSCMAIVLLKSCDPTVCPSRVQFVTASLSPPPPTRSYLLFPSHLNSTTSGPHPHQNSTTYRVSSILTFLKHNQNFIIYLFTYYLMIIVPGDY